MTKTLTVLALLFSFGAYAQCNANTSICSGNAGPFNFVTPGPQVSTCLDFFGPNVGYIILHISTTGPLQMLIDGNSSSGFIDVAVFNIPAGQAPCTAIQNTANQIGCNYASASSGCNQFGTYFPCAASVPAPNVTAGQDIMIVAENWSGSSSTFTLSLSPPPGAQAAPANSTITPAGPFCVTSPAVQLTAADMGGTWSGPGVSSTGVFNPSSVAPGTYTISYQVGSGACASGVSTTSITVNSSSISVSPANSTICSGGSTVLTASGAGSYSWSPSSSLSSSTGSTVTASPTTNTTYTVTGTTAGCSSTATATVNIGPSPSVNTIPNQTWCAGATVPITAFSGTPASATYNWTNSNPAIGLAASGTGSLPSYTATNPGSTPITSTVTVTPTNSGCTGTPKTFTITVNPTPVVSSTNQTWCAGETVPATTFSPTPSGSSVSWTNSNSAIGLGGSGTGNLPSFTAANPGSSPITGVITLTPSLSGCTGTPSTFNITVNPPPVVNSVADQTECGGVAASVPISGSTGASFNWTNTNTSIGLGSSGTGSISFTTTNSGTTPITSTITVTPSIGACVGSPETFSFTVNPAPLVSAVSNQTACNGDAVPGSAFNVTPASSTLNWSNSNTSIGLGASGSGNYGSFNCTNSGSSATTATITVTSDFNGCPGNSVNYTITVNPTPVMNSMANMAQCTGTMFTPSGMGSNPPGAAFVWTNSNTGIGMPASGNGAPAGFMGTNNGSVPMTSTVTVTPTMSGCQGPPSSFTITVNPLPNVTASNNGPLCANDDLQLTATSNGSTFSWTGPSGFTSNLQNPTVQGIQSGQTGTYTVTATSAGCTATASTTVSITTGQPAQVNAVSPLCEDAGSVALSANVSGGSWSGTGVTDPASGIFDPSVSGPGTFQVTFTPTNTCYQPGSAAITVKPLPVVDFQADQLTGCAPLIVNFTDLTSPAGGTRYWTFGDGNSDVSLYQTSNSYPAGSFSVTLNAEVDGCQSSTTKQNYISVYEQAFAAFTVDHTSTEMSNPNFHFTNMSTGASSYIWDFDDNSGSTLENPSHQYEEYPGGYTVTLICNNAGNCPDTAKMNVRVNEELIYYVPNSFTPDGDEFNNVFQPVFYSGFDPQNYELVIFDRWGEVLFESRNAEIGWDGTYGNAAMKEGTYIWKLRFKAMTNDKKYTDSGSVTLIR